MKFNTIYDAVFLKIPKLTEEEEIQNEPITEQTGYRSLHDIVEDMKKSGLKLNIEKHLIYNSGTEEDLEEVAEIYSGAFDIEDISAARLQIKQLLLSRGEAEKAQIIEKGESTPEGGGKQIETPSQSKETVVQEQGELKKV